MGLGGWHPLATAIMPSAVWLRNRRLEIIEQYPSLKKQPAENERFRTSRANVPMALPTTGMGSSARRTGEMRMRGFYSGIEDPRIAHILGMFVQLETP